MNLADIRKRHGLDEKKTEKKSTTQTTASHMLDEIRARHNLGKVTSTREKVEEAKAAPRLYKNEAEYYAKTDYLQGRTKYDELLQRDAELESLAKELETETYQGSRKGTQYINWMRDREARMDANKADKEKNAAKVAEWDEFYGEGSLYGYNELAKNEDFEQNSRAKIPDYISKGLSGVELMLSEDYGKADTVYNYINNIGNTREAVNEAKDPTSTFGKYDNMTDDERKLYTYIHNTKGAEDANSYLKKLGLEQRGFEKAQAADEQFAKDKPVTAWLISRINNGYLTAQAGADLIMQTIKKLATGEDINYYSTAQAMHAGKGTFDAAVAEKAQEAVPIRIAGIDMTKLAVSALSSGIDSMAFSVLPGGAGAIALAVDAGISGMRTAAQNGATDGQALLKGVSSAVFEYLFERVSLGNFKAMQETGISGWKDVFKNITKSMGVNMTEEMATEAANIAYDMLLGYDYSEIQGASGRDLLKQVVEAGLSGMLMGIGFGAAGNISSGVQFQQFKNQWTEEVKQQLVDNGVAEEDAEKSAKLLFEMAMEEQKQSEAQSETDAANADFANKVLDENAAQTTEDAKTEEMPSNRATEAYTQMVQNYADSMDAAGQNVFIEAYDGSVEPDVYVREMQDAYDAGRRGESLAASETAIGDDRRQLAYKAGVADRVTEQADYGFVHNEVSRTVDRKLVQDLNRIGKDLKVKIQFVDSVRGGAAQGSYRNGVVTISRRADDPYMVVAKHEITHHLEKVAPKAYAAYQAYAVETVAKGYGKTVDTLVQDRIAVAARHGDRLTEAEARAEIAADFTEMIFADTKTLHQFVEANSKSAEGRNMLQRLWDAVRRFIASLKKTKVSIDAEAARKLKLDGVIDHLEQAEMLLREALKEGGQQRTGVSGDGGKTIWEVTLNVANTTDGAKILYDIDPIKKVGQSVKSDTSLPNTNIPQPGTSVKSQNSTKGVSLRDLAQTRDTDYLDAVKRGDMETAQRMVDEAAKAAGYDKLFYHGAKKGGGFTVFRDWQYFTENKRYAARYADRNSDKSLYTTYVKLEKPFDTRKAADRKLFNAIRQEYGLTEIQDSGLPDWTDGYDISDYIDENDLDYDGIILDEGGDMVNGKPVSRGASYVVRKSAQIKSADSVTYDDNGNVIPLSERFNPKQSDIRYSTKGGGLDALRKQYGEIEPGENPVRQAHVPRKTEKNKNVSQTVRTIIEAGATPDVVLPDIEKLVQSGDFSYESYGDKDAVANAEKRIKFDGWERSLTEWEKAVASGKVSKDLTTMGWVLYNNAVNKAKTTPDTEVRKERIKASVNILTAMVGQQRNAAQALQATRILKKLSPQAQLYGIVRSVASLQNELEKKYGAKAPNLKIDAVLAERVLTATSEKARDEAMHDIYRDIGRQMPSSFLDKWNAWRYLAMLGNFRTHGRNIAGNIIFTPFVWMKNLTATAIESAWKGIRKDKFQRTKALPSKDLISAAYSDYVKLTDKQMAGGDKYNENAVANEYINEGRQIWGQKTKVGKVAEAVRKFNSDMLSAEDAVAKRVHYSIAMAQYCKANGITAEMLTANDGAYDAKIDGARDYAMKEAKKATFNDANAVTQAIQQMAKIKGLDVLMDAVLPFRKTPVNILLRAIEYSPIGFAKSISFDIWQVYKGKKTAAEVIDGMAAGLTGMGLMVAGAILAKMGLIRGMNGEDEEERKFNELQGYQGYSLVAWDRTYTLDWLAPGAMPFFVGVNIAEAKALEEMNVADIVDMIGNVSAPLLDMSCLQSLNDMIEAIGTTYGSGLSALYKAPVNAATSYVTQALPTIFGQVERVTESTRQQTYTNKNNKVLTSDVQYTLGKALNKTLNPFDDVGQIPYIDAWGRETSTGNVGARAFNNLLNPGYSAKIRTSEMEKELQRLFDETGEKSVLPDRAAKYITVEGEKIDLNKNQYVKYATVKGQTAYDMLTKITASAQYKALDEQSKVDLISKVYSYANAIAKAEVTKTQKDKALWYQPDGWIKKAADTSKATGIPAWKYVLIYNGQTDIRGLTDKDGNTISLSSSLLMMEYLYSFIGLSDAQRQALYADFGVAKSVRHYDKQRVAQELKKMRAKAAK